MRCFVPNCENTVGVPFPEDQELKNIWLKSLNIEDIIPDDESFVCLDHFENNDVEDVVNEENFLERRLLPSAVPKLCPIKDTSEGGSHCQLNNENLESPPNDSESSNFFIPINEESSAQSEVVENVSEVEPNFSNADPELELSTQNSFLNSEQDSLELGTNNVINEEQNEIVNTVQKQEDIKSVQEENGAETDIQEVVHGEPQPLPVDTEGDKQNPLSTFYKYEEALSVEDFLRAQEAENSNLPKASVVENQNKDDIQETDSLGNNEFLSVQSEFEPQILNSDKTESNQESDQIFSSEEHPVFTTASELFVAEGQNIFTTAGQQVYVSEGQTILTSEGQQVYVTEGQTVFTTNGQQVFVSAGQTLITQEGQTLLTEDGQRVFLEGDGQSFNEQDNFITSNDNFQNADGAQQPNVVDHGSGEQISVDQSQISQNETNMESLIQNIKHENQVQNVTENIQQNFINPRHLVVNEQLLGGGFHADLEQHESTETENQGTLPAAVIVKKEVEDSPRNILMEWFVPSGTNETTQSGANFSGVLGAQQHTQLISQQPVAGGSQRNVTGVSYQRIPAKRSLETNVASTSRKPNEHETFTDETCRLCGIANQKFINILDNIKNNVMILEAIQLCIHPLEVSLEDPFSKKICVGCFNSLQKYYEFRQKCLEMNIVQVKQYEKAHPHHKLEKIQFINDFPTKRSHMKTIISPSKTGYRQTEVLTVTNSSKGYGAKNITRKIILTPTPIKKEETKQIKKEPDGDFRKVISKTSKFDNIKVYNSSTQNRMKSAAQKAPGLSVLSPKKFTASQIEALARHPLSPEKQLKVQEELKKVIEGKMSKEELSVDQVIVRVVSDDESDDVSPPKRRRLNVVNTSVTKTGHSKMRIGKSEVVIPKGIRVSIPERFESSKGIFPCFKKQGAYDTEFSLIDGYLFEHRLCKGKERNLRCLSVSCPARAVQRILAPDFFDNKANVTVPHTHHPLTSTEIKKQMFYYIMKKKMQADRGMNFRNIYDKLCQRDPEIAVLVPLRSLINEICKHQLTQKIPHVESFNDFYNVIEDDALQKFQFTFTGKQFYQERFSVEEEGTKAVVFANVDTIKNVSNSKLMYVDASFRIDTSENFNYQLVTVLVWIDDSYYPIMFALVSKGTMEIFKKIFGYLHDTLAPNLCPDEIVTDYEANIYYALGETYLDSHIGGSVFYYTQNLYKKICELGLAKELESHTYFRNIYHMLLMLPLLPVNTIMDGLQNIEIQANDLRIGSTTAGLFEHIKEQWMEKVTPDLFCVHRLENRINENVIAPFKKLRDFLMLNKGKNQRQSLTLVNVVEKLIELENFLQTTYSSENKKSFGRDLSSSQKKNVLKAWHYIESHPKININHFFTKVIGYIKCMENQLWIWGYYKYPGKVTEELINASNFSIVNTNDTEMASAEDQDAVLAVDPNVSFVTAGAENTLVMEAVVGPSGEFVLSNPHTNQETGSSIFKYVYKKDA